MEPKSKAYIAHYFGSYDGALTIGERLCNEPLVPGMKIDTIYHTSFEMLPGGNFVCFHCGEKFLEEP